MLFRSLVGEGQFPGGGALSESVKATVSGGLFNGPDFGITSQQMIVKGGEFSGPGLLKFSQNALFMGGRIIGEAAFEEARNISVLTDGTIPEIRNPLSGLIVAKRIGRIIFDKGKPPDMVIISESVGEGAAYADRIEVGCVPMVPPEPSEALKALQALTAIHPG